MEVSLADVVALADDRVALVLETRIHAPEDDMLVQLNRDGFVVLAVDPDAMASLQASSRSGTYDTAEVLGPKKRRPTLDPAAATTVPVPIPADMGVRYGRVSGDLNVVHTTRVAARLVGHGTPFIQGPYTANHPFHGSSGMDVDVITLGSPTGV